MREDPREIRKARRSAGVLITRGYDGNAARDVELYPREPERRRDPERKKEQAQKQEPFIRIAATVIIGVLILLAAITINGQVRLTELNDSTVAIKKELTAAESENTRLRMQFTSSVSIENVESYAINELGMRKLEKYQIKYVEVKIDESYMFKSPDENIFPKDVNQKLKSILGGE